MPLGERSWGTFDEDADEVTIHEDREPGDEDLLDRAALETMLNGGTVYAVKQEAMPLFISKLRLRTPMAILIISRFPPGLVAGCVSAHGCLKAGGIMNGPTQIEDVKTKPTPKSIGIH